MTPPRELLTSRALQLSVTRAVRDAGDFRAMASTVNALRLAAGFASLGSLLLGGAIAAQHAPERPAILRREFVSDTLSAPSVHASTIVAVPGGLLAAWFGGSHEGANDVGIWASRFVDGRWTEPAEIAVCVGPDGSRTACWNPVLFADARGAIRLFYKSGPGPARWWGMAQYSTDAGRSWSTAERLPPGVLGPIKNKPVMLAADTIVSGSSTESTANPSSWRVHFERSTDGGRTWTIVPAEQRIDAIQPSILVHADGRLEAVGRTRSGRIFETWSADRGAHWSELALTALPNPNSGLDAVTLRDGRQLIVYNHTSNGRSPLNVAVSRDGKLWEAAVVLEDEPGAEFSYPAVIQTADELVHITYTWKRRRIRHVVIDPARLRTTPMPAGRWPPAVR
ncbi:MAG TPA: sialidase family protein [Gemmatimonadaceae bacterium]|nr:sialidase family protein [Gemmatimonadaceae bacterium]